MQGLQFQNINKTVLTNILKACRSAMICPSKKSYVSNKKGFSFLRVEYIRKSNKVIGLNGFKIYDRNNNDVSLLVALANRDLQPLGNSFIENKLIVKSTTISDHNLRTVYPIIDKKKLQVNR